MANYGNTKNLVKITSGSDNYYLLCTAIEGDDMFLNEITHAPGSISFPVITGDMTLGVTFKNVMCLTWTGATSGWQTSPEED